ncbi:MAG: esterase-like activity of phytase family protein [Micrococcales bacterium]|nr:esterase-like activity of phytase family protein [Micrococcales bacterium]
MHTSLRFVPAGRSARALLALGTAGALAVTGVSLAAPAAATPSTGVVVSEVYGGGGNSGAPVTNDFVELQNRGASAVDVTGWSVQYLPAVPTAASTWRATPLTGTIPPGATFLVAEAAGASGTAALPTPDASGTIAMSATAGTIALVSSGTPLSCTTAAGCEAEAAKVDLVGFGSAVVREGAAAPAPSNTSSDSRTSAADTDDNATDFTTGAPTPTNSRGETTGGGTGPVTPPTPGAVRIRDIQGAGWISPLAGQQVTGVPGVVTAVRGTGSSRGYWIQDPAPDADPVTSEGVFVFTGSMTPTVAAGDSVLVSGRVSDYNPGGNPANPAVSTLSVTEITTATVAVLARGAGLPAPVVLTPTTVPDAFAPDLGGASIELTAVQPARSALDFYESLEGMRVQVDDARVVGPSNEYGEQFVTTKPDQNRSARGATVLTADNRIPSGRLAVTTLTGANLALRVGDVLPGATAGPLDYTSFTGYNLVAAQLGEPLRNGLPREAAAPQRADQLSVATYNVENLAPGDPAEKYRRLAEGVVTSLASPDVVAIEELQDDTGAVDDGVVTAGRTLTALTQAIAAAGGPFYQWRQIDPADKTDGGQPGGNIRTGFLYNPARVTFVDRGAADADRTSTPTAVGGRRGAPQLTLSPGRINPASDAWANSRKPLAGEFRFRGETVFVIGNHFNSKGGDQSADGRYQYPVQSSRVQRQKQAAEVNAFVTGILARDAKAKVVVAGDLNDFPFSPPLATLTGADTGKRILTDLISTLPANEQYTYIYNGVAQVLDHILVTAGVGSPEYRVVHINAEFEGQASDHDPQLVRISVPRVRPSLPVCSPSALALGYSDRLDKAGRGGATVGGLSSLAYDRRSDSWASTVDTQGTEPARIWFFRSLSSPTIARDPLVLKRADGTPYTGVTADDEGLAILPSGDFVVSSETEPSVRIFGRDGVQKAALPVPERFAVSGTAPEGQATADATLEGLTITPSGRTIVAAMEGALSGDVSAAGDATARRFLVYSQDRRGAWTLSKQLAYRADAGLRVPEVAAYTDDALLVEEAGYAPVVGNTVRLYAVTGLSSTADVSTVADLSGAPASAFAAKKPIADLGTCPTLGATSRQLQANPLLENYEGMAITGGGFFGAYGVSLISDDDFGATQVTRILNLAADLPRR